MLFVPLPFYSCKSSPLITTADKHTIFKGHVRGGVVPFIDTNPAPFTTPDR
jgi:hypothetical protein